MLTAYFSERVPAPVFVPLAIGLAFAAGGLSSDPRRLTIEIGLALLLLVQYRLWDDLADRRHDAVTHPGRVLVQARTPWPAIALCLALAAVNVAGALGHDRSGRSALMVVALTAVLAAWYAGRESRTALGDLLLLTKYPAIVLVLAGDRLVSDPAPLLAAAALVYAAACAYEAWHDTSSFGRSFMSASVAFAPAPVPLLEPVVCYLCGGRQSTDFITAEDDLTGRPGRFRFVRCGGCGLAYQNPRVPIARIGEYYDDAYIAHRKRTTWGVLTPLFERAMNRLDIDKDRLVSRYITLDRSSEVLDVGCAVGTFLQRLRRCYGVRAAGVDFKDLSSAPSLDDVEFHCGLFYDVPLESDRFDLVTMWHFLEHDYDPIKSLRTARRVMKPGGRVIIEVPRLDSRTFRWFGDRWPGLQAPQHTVLFDRDRLLRAADAAGLEVVAYLPYGAFPAYFYLFMGVAFKWLKGRGVNLERAIVPYFAGQLLALPFLLFERRLNLAMQTIVCRRAS